MKNTQSFILKLPLQNVNDSTRSPKGKIPWIEWNGEAVSDSSFIIKYLNKKLNIHLNSAFSKEDRAIAHSLRKMIEENDFW